MRLGAPLTSRIAPFGVLLLPRGGIPPAARRRSRLALTLAERVDISRGPASGSPLREIARRLDRAASTVTREISRHGGRPAYRAHVAHSFVSDIRSLPGGCSRFSRCCYLIIVLSSHLFGESWASGVSSSHLDSAVELDCSDRNSRPRHASLFGYRAMVRTPLHLPTTDGAVPPTFEPRQRPLVSW
jgi:hypothetical protein